jgi:vacuolar-type H+-ATPase catalytic subunit A/Vma1
MTGRPRQRPVAILAQAPGTRGPTSDRANGRRLRQDFLQQSAFDEVEAFSPPAKQHAMPALVRHLQERCVAALEEEPVMELLMLQEYRRSCECGRAACQCRDPRGLQH